MTFGIYSADLSLAGTTTLTLRAHLTDYPVIKTVDVADGSLNQYRQVQIEILDPCLDPVSVVAADQGAAPLEYRYTGD